MWWVEGLGSTVWGFRFYAGQWTGVGYRCDFYDMSAVRIVYRYMICMKARLQNDRPKTSKTGFSMPKIDWRFWINPEIKRAFIGFITEPIGVIVEFIGFIIEFIGVIVEFIGVILQLIEFIIGFIIEFIGFIMEFIGL
jgi:hypothetical protein